jgi:hypothetical protein
LSNSDDHACPLEIRMSELPVNDPSTRRDFITGLTVGAAGLMAAACTPGATAQTAPTPTAAAGPVSYIETTRGNFTMLRPATWDDSWTKRLGKYRTVFDVSELTNDAALYQVEPILDNYKEALGATDADMGFVLIIRHAAMAMAVQDAMWDKYNLRADMKRSEDSDAPPTPPKGNPFARTISDCQKRGVTILGCNVAMNGFSNRTARRVGGDAKAIKAELFANLWPGMILLPTGVYALTRAQDVGCGYMT